MTLSIRTANMTCYPISNTSADGKKVYNSVDLMEPVSYNVSFSAEGGKNPEQLKKAWEKYAEDGTELDLTFSQKKGRFGQEIVIYDLKPVTQKANS